jgi:hypothetical protein
MIITLICILLFLQKTLYGAGVEIRFKGSYGISAGNFGYYHSGEPDECFAVPLSFYVCENNTILVQDQNNKRTQIIAQNGEIDILREYISIKHVSMKDSVITGEYCVVSFRSMIGKQLFRFQRENESLSYFLEHPSGYKILTSNFDRYYFDGMYKPIEANELPPAIRNIGVVYLSDENAMISDCFLCLRKHVTNFYDELSGQEEDCINVDIFAFPDSSEWGSFFSDSTPQMNYLGVDKNFSTYWSAVTNVSRKYQGAYGFPEPTPEGLVYHNYHEQVWAIFCYDRLGKLLFWFPEPKLKEGQKRYCGDIVVNDKGRIFQMNFYSRNKRPTKQSEGIEIVEYIPDEIDKSHEGRVKRYGQGKK